MAKFRKVYTDFWEDGKVMEEMTPEDKFFFLYLLTNPHTSQVGIYQISKKMIAFEMGYSIESINSLFDRFEHHHGLIKYNPDTREIAIKNWGKYNLNRGGKPVEDCVRSELKQVKDPSLISYVAESITNEKIKALFDSYNDTSDDTCHDTSYDTYDDTLTISGQEKEEEKEEEEEKEKEEEVAVKDRTGDSNPEPAPAPATPGSIIQHFQKCFQMQPNAIQREFIGKIQSKVHPDVIMFAMTKAAENGKTFAYAKAILVKWLQKGITTMKQVEAEQREFEQKRNQRPGANSEVVPEWFKKYKDQDNVVPTTRTSEKTPEEIQREREELEKALYGL